MSANSGLIFSKNEVEHKGMSSGLIAGLENAIDKSSKIPLKQLLIYLHNHNEASPNTKRELSDLINAIIERDIELARTLKGINRQIRGTIFYPSELDELKDKYRYNVSQAKIDALKNEHGILGLRD